MAEIRKCRFCGKEFLSRKRGNICNKCRSRLYEERRKGREEAIQEMMRRKEERERLKHTVHDPHFVGWRFVMPSPGKWDIVRVFDQ